MKHRVQFVTLEEDEKDLIVSFAIEDPRSGVRSLILLRTLFFEEYLPEEERGVKVSLEGDEPGDDHRNILVNIEIGERDIVVESTLKEYHLDVSKVDRSELYSMIQLLKKQNYDDRFTMRIALNC